MTVRPTPAVERRVTPRLPFPDGLERRRGLHFCTGNVPAARPKNEAPAGRAQSPRAADRTFIAAPFRDVARAHEVDVRRRATPAAGAAAGSPAESAARRTSQARTRRGYESRASRSACLLLLDRSRHVPCLTPLWVSRLFVRKDAPPRVWTIGVVCSRPKGVWAGVGRTSRSGVRAFRRSRCSSARDRRPRTRDPASEIGPAPVVGGC